jgi:hypothetical protein
MNDFFHSEIFGTVCQYQEPFHIVNLVTWVAKTESGIVNSVQLQSNKYYSMVFCTKTQKQYNVKYSSEINFR